MDFELTMRAISFGALEIRFYSLMILSGILAGVLLAQREAARRGEDPAHVTTIAVVGTITGLAGARAYHVIDQWSYYSANPGSIIAIWNGGIGIYGGAAGAVLGLVFYVWWVNSVTGRRRGARRLNPWVWLDIGAPAFLLGQAIGRWGNFFNQELFGPPTDLPWGIPIDAVYRPAQYADATHFHPLFLYESILSLIGVIVLVFIARRFAHRLLVGDVLLLYLVWYPAERYGLEFMRTDNWTLGDIPTAQIIGSVLVVFSIVAMIIRHRRARPPQQTPQGPDGASSRAAMRRRRRRMETGQDG